MRCRLTGLRPGQRALDVAGGTGDLAAGLLRQVGKSGRVVLSDINPAHARDRPRPAARFGVRGQLECLVADAERLPFGDDCFDCVTIGFGLRNVTDKAAALASMHRVLKPGGQLLVLEFSKPVAPGLKPLYDAYSFNVLPRSAGSIAKDAASYRYLAESIRMHPDQETLLGMLRTRASRRPLSQSQRRHRRRCTAATRSDMPATPVWLAAVEAVLNRSIGASAQAAPPQRLERHLAATSTSTACPRSAPAVAGNRLALAADAAPARGRDHRRSPSSRGSAARAAALAQGRRAEARAAPASTVRGDAEIAGRYRELFALARPGLGKRNCRGWWAICPRGAFRCSRRARVWLRRARRTAGENIAEYLQEESRDLVNKHRARGVSVAASTACAKRPIGSRRGSPGSSSGCKDQRDAPARRGPAAEIQRALVRHGLDDFVRATHLYRPLRFLFYLSPWTWFQRSAGVTRGERLRLALEELGPIFVKFGQALSTRRDLIPVDIADELAKLQDRVPPFDSDVAVATIEQHLRAAARRYLSSFEKAPLAAASIAQVHAATLKSGEEVVVKILRPGMHEVIERDLEVLDTLARARGRVLGSDARRLRPLEVVREYRKTILDELDLMREAGNAAQLKRNFAGSPLLYVPVVYWDYCRANVMVMERIHGIIVSRVDELRARGTDIAKLAENGVEIFFTQVFRHNFFHADMHPGNIFVQVDDPREPALRRGGLRHRRHAAAARSALSGGEFHGVLRPRLRARRRAAHRVGLGAAGRRGSMSSSPRCGRCASPSSTSR